ncbi:class III extradiol ring-cleavage dioxygenase [Teredinibacter turnerae]|uniref:DODA-type extradiol aromatic ring-opening family dioxygenase n=1 Tax=Teredinibacter turnerae TaxID=2426 RepID=UPI0030CEBED1
MQHLSENTRHRALFVSHGGGPLPLLGDPQHREMRALLETIVQGTPLPAAIVVISAHWEASGVRVTGARNPSLLYDYGGFPDAAYHIQYPCPGEPALAQEIVDLLRAEPALIGEVNAELDNSRGLDHGVFVPLKLMFPQANIPVIQVSLAAGLNPLQHIHIGRALAKLSRGNLLFIGSGFTFHNFRAFFSPSEENEAKNTAFLQCLDETVGGALDEAQRVEQLTKWELAPFARFCHPREEHLIPLMVVYGIAGRASSRSLHAQILNYTAGFYCWD